MTTTVWEQRAGPNILIRALWYVFVGWWATGVAMALAWLAAITIIGLPLAFWIVNRIPSILTLRPRRELYATSTDGGTTTYRRIEVAQHGLIVRLAWFVLVGWWLSLAWSALAWGVSVTIIGIPLGLWMINRLPAVFTLHRGYA